MSPKQLLKSIKSGIRLKTKSPKIEIPKNIYTRKQKHGKQKFSID
jgi:hypothetical protein